MGSKVSTNGQTETTIHYGATLYNQIKSSIIDYDQTSEFEKFVLNRGFEFDTETELNAAFHRCQSVHNGILLSEEDFLAEAKSASSTLAAETYKALVALVDQRALTPSNVYQYARYGWCLSSPDAIIAYRTGPQNQWTVNNLCRPNLRRPCQTGGM